MVATRAMRRADYKSIAYLQWSISPQLAITPKLLLRALPSVFALSVLAHTPSNVSSSSTGDRIPRIHSIWRSTALFHVASAPRLVKMHSDQEKSGQPRMRHETCGIDTTSIRLFILGALFQYATHGVARNEQFLIGWNNINRWARSFLAD